MAKNPFTGLDDEVDNPARSIISGNGALAPLLGDPQSRAALLQIGLNLMQPAEQGQTTAGALARGIGAGGEVEARLAKEEFERQKHEDELDKSNRTLAIRQQEADAYSKAQEAAGVRAGSYDRMALQELKDRNAAARLGTKNYHGAAVEQFAAVQKEMQSILYNPEKPSALVQAYGGKTIPQIEKEMREGDAASGGGVVSSKGSQDDQARAWAVANPNDPRAAAIRQRLGM